MLLKKHVFGLITLLSAIYTGAQNCNLALKGCVLDEDKNEHLGFAVIKLLNTGKILETNEHGEFVFENLCPNTYQLLIKHLGCHDTVIEVDLKFSKRINIKLPHSLNNLSEVDIMDKRLEMKKTQTESQLSEEDRQKAKGESLGETLKNISGVSALNTGASISKPMIHGMQGCRLLILNNGIRQEGQQWGNEHAPEIDPFIARKISVIKGAAAIRYGSDAIAGVVLVEADELPDTAAVTGEVNLSGISNGQAGIVSGILQGNFEKLKHISWRAQGTYKKGGSLKTPDYYLSNTALEEKNFSYALNYHYKKVGAEIYYSQFNTAIGIFKGSHIGNLSDLQAALNTGKPIDSLSEFSYTIARPNQQVSHELLKALAHYHFSSKWRAKLQYAWQYNLRQEYDLRRLTNSELQSGVVPPDLDLRITSQTLDALLEHDNIKSFRGTMGASYMYQDNSYKGRFFIPNYYNNTWGIFVTERYVMRHAELEAGLRYDAKKLQSFFYKGKDWVNVKRDFSNVTYNVGYIWKRDSTFNLFVNAGSAWRAPAANELFSDGIHQGVSAIERGNENLKTERCYNITTTGIFKRKKVLAELTLYHNQFQNFIYLNPAGNFELTIRGAFPVFNYTQANTRISGMDAKAEFNLGKRLVLQAKGMWVRAWNYAIKDYLIYMPGDRGDVSLRIKIPELKKCVNTYFQINNTFVSKQWRVPANADFAAPPAGYYLLGFDFASTIKIKKQKILLNFSANNLLNARYREFLDRFRYYCDAVGRSYKVTLTIPLQLYYKPKK
ncbi:MAG: TonB-dependent receptor [Bacteroidia bacterium]|nr:TonB-dependent receptor [Bacteroidia bacterium]